MKGLPSAIALLIHNFRTMGKIGYLLLVMVEKGG
jgi:hypothetical protein